MNRIYRQSIRTVIWLPLDKEKAIAAKSLILKMSRYHEARAQLHVEHNSDEGATAQARNDKSEVSLPSIDDRSWGALESLLGLPWFERVWVIQEVALSTRSPIVLCGTQLIPWLDIEEVARRMEQRPSEIGYLPGARLVDDTRIIGRKVVWNDGTDDVTWDIQSLLLLTSRFIATNPRDRIFALLGLCKDTRHPDNWPVELNPDYEKPLLDVFTHVTKFCIRQTKTLEILGMVGHTLTVWDKDFPSWVLRYDSPMRMRPSIGIQTFVDYVDYRFIVDDIHDASRGMNVIMDDTTQPEILRLRGVRLCSPILFCSTVWSRETVPLSKKISKRFRQGMIRTLDSCREHLPHLSTAELHRAFFMVTTVGTTWDCEDAVDEPLIHFKAYMRIQEVETSLPTIDDQIESTNSTLGSHIPAEPDGRHYARNLQCIRGRRLFTIAPGLLGLGPDEMAATDVIVILFGGSVPYVLRPSDSGQWLFVGTCYIYGLMKGEALQGDGANEENYEWFELV
jgi:hypothetical protein